MHIKVSMEQKLLNTFIDYIIIPEFSILRFYYTASISHT